MQISITITGDKETITRIQNLGSSLYQMKSAMEVIGKELTVYYAGRAWSQKGRAFQQPWVQITDKRQAIKNKFYRGKGILEAKGTMKDSFEYSASETSVVIDNSADQFKYHQSTMTRKVMPRRIMIGNNSVVTGIVRNAVKIEINIKIARST